jgi:hypothetical protein
VASDGGAVPLDVILAQVGEETAAAADELEQTTTGVIVVTVQAQMSRESL